MRTRHSLDQPEHMDTYASPEHILVSEAPIFPFYYGQVHMLQKPWLKDPYLGCLAVTLFKDITIEPH